MKNYCNICKILMNQKDKPETRDCGGDCLMCMARVGDPDAQESLNKLGIKYETS